MKYRATEPFWQAYAQLPPEVKRKARRAFRLFKQGAEHPPFHPSLRIRKMQGHPGIWEGHITLQYVFTCHIEEDPDTGETIFVFRNIGSHEIYRKP
jgi:hypothetical protein